LLRTTVKTATILKSVNSMSKKANKKDKSALNVMPGVTGGHDGMPSTNNRAESMSDKNNSIRRRDLSVEQFVKGVRAGNRVVLARAITLIESASAAHQAKAQEVLTALLPHRCQSVRVGITGVPGAGKSTFIEALGTLLTARGHKVAVTAVDPSSSLTGGSILGDKTRMEKLSANQDAFIRPSPSSGTLGGVARRTRETIVLFEAAGYDVILVETVGVGQSEILVRSMVDFFLLMLISGAGDELQGIKKGVVEIADAILINKADGAGKMAAQQAKSEFNRVLHYLRPATEGWETRAFNTSALKADGILELWHVVEKFLKITTQSGNLNSRRSDQEKAWMHSLVRDGLHDIYHKHPGVRAKTEALELMVASGKMPATTAARQLLELFGSAGN